MAEKKLVIKIPAQRLTHNIEGTKKCAKELLDAGLYYFTIDDVGT